VEGFLRINLAESQRGYIVVPHKMEAYATELGFSLGSSLVADSFSLWLVFSMSAKLSFFEGFV
jgi:hypothetical protein